MKSRTYLCGFFKAHSRVGGMSYTCGCSDVPLSQFVAIMLTYTYSETAVK